MRKLNKILIAACFLILGLTSVSRAAVSPLGIDIFKPVQFPPEDFSVAGLRVTALYGQHRNMYGIDLAAIGNVTDLTFTGIAISGIFNRTYGQTTAIGLQLAGITNINSERTKVVGAQIALVNSNVAESTIVGFEIGPIANLAPHTTVYGIQAGLYNKVNEVYGLQIGLLNFASSVHGLQIGLLNFQEHGIFAVSPILNFGF